MQDLKQSEGVSQMKVIFDPETDTLSLIFREERIAESDEVREREYCLSLREKKELLLNGVLIFLICEICG